MWVFYIFLLGYGMYGGGYGGGYGGYGGYGLGMNRFGSLFN